ncbi:MAG: LysE family transporter [Synergistaceae bacterium]
MEYFLQGLTMGLAYVAPIGLQNLFVINTAMTQKKSRVILTALIVIFFDVTLALACFFGVGAVMERSHTAKLAILLIGSLTVIFIGFSLIKADASMQEKNVSVPIWSVVTTACVVTWFNPQALIDGTMMLGAFRASLPPSAAALFMWGVAAASCLWFSGISAVITLFSARFTSGTLKTINIVCGTVVIFYGLKLLWNFIELMR